MRHAKTQQVIDHAHSILAAFHTMTLRQPCLMPQKAVVDTTNWVTSRSGNVGRADAYSFRRISQSPLEGVDICRFLNSLRLRRFYPTVFFVENQSLLHCLLARQVGEEVPHQGLFGFETTQIVLRALDHQAQACQWLTERLL